MGATLESRKLRIVDFLAELDDESMILQIENLLFPKNNWWEEISEKEKASILRGMKDAESGKKTDFHEFMTNLRQKHHAH
jgi:hypothetical protein